MHKPETGITKKVTLPVRSKGRLLRSSRGLRAADFVILALGPAGVIDPRHAQFRGMAVFHAGLMRQSPLRVEPKLGLHVAADVIHGAVDRRVAVLNLGVGLARDYHIL